MNEVNKQKLKTDLLKHIEKFIDESCEKDYWIDSYVPQELSIRMTDSAFSVIELCEDHEDYLKSEGLMNE